MLTFPLDFLVALGLGLLLVGLAREWSKPRVRPLMPVGFAAGGAILATWPG